eukprot:15473841-Alexandrium_andersonii.AAC.1
MSILFSPLLSTQKPKCGLMTRAVDNSKGDALTGGNWGPGVVELRKVYRAKALEEGREVGVLDVEV